MKESTTEKYIKRAIKEAKKELSGNVIQGCNFEMTINAETATEVLAEALQVQAEANKVTGEAMLKLAHALKPTDACIIKIGNTGNVKIAGANAKMQGLD